jgi:hypothetical protein
MNHSEKGNGLSVEGASVSKSSKVSEILDPQGHYHVECYAPSDKDRARYIKLRDKLAGRKFKRGFFAHIVDALMFRGVKAEFAAIPLHMKWQDDIENVVCTEGKNAAFQAIFKASAFTAAPVMGLIGNVTYTAPAVGNVASAINTAASANSWNEAAASVCAARQTPSFAAPSAGVIALSTARTFSIIGTDTINGVFVLIHSVALVAPTTAVANTAGAIWSAGAFTGGAKPVLNGDTLNVSYTASM